MIIREKRDYSRKVDGGEGVTALGDGDYSLSRGDSWDEEGKRRGNVDACFGEREEVVVVEVVAC